MDKKILGIVVGIVVIGVAMVGLMQAKNSQKGAGKTTVLSSRTAKELYNQALAFKREGKLMEAKASYQKIIADYPNIENIDVVQRELEALTLGMIFSGAATSYTVTHDVQAGDSLGKIAKKYNTTVELLKRMNNLKSDVIAAGRKLKVWTGVFNVYIDKSQNSLMLRNGNELVKVYQVSTGTNNITPVGKFKIVNKLIDPVWFKPGAILPPESPENVLGSRWMGFDIPGYGIHGTIDPATIGQPVTAGCVRMRNEDVEELYSLVPLGTEVVIVD